MQTKILLGVSLLVLCLFGQCFAKLPKGVTVINSVNASYPSDSDLRPFDKLARKAEIFAIGESAHGVAGYQNFQFRLTKYLITEHGYRRVLSEILSDDTTLNVYLTTGQGNLSQILYLNPWQGSDIEMYNFFSWIRSFNVLHPNSMVNVYAVDPQMPWENAPVIQAFLQKYDAKYNQSFSTDLFPTILNTCFGASFANQIEWAFSQEATDYYTCGCLPENKTAACVSAISYVEDMVRSEYKPLEKWLGETEVGDVQLALRSLRSWQTKSAALYIDPLQAVRYREAVFGENALWLARRNNKKKHGTVLIAHNLHISKTTLKTTFLGNDLFYNIHTAGYIVDSVLGSKYVAVAQSGYRVAPMFGAAYPLPSSPLSIDVTLNSLNQSWLLLDTSANWVTAQGTWLTQEEGVPNGRYYDLESSFNRLVFHAVAPKGVFIRAAPPTVTVQSHLSARMIKSNSGTVSDADSESN